MRRITSLLLSLMLILVFTSCGLEDKKESSGDAQKDKVVETDAESSEDSEDVDEEESETTDSDEESENKPSKTTNSNKKHTHSFEAKTIKATCTKEGYTQKTCSCGYVEKENYTKALGHSFGDWKTVKSPTNSSEGSKERVCSTCGHKETQSIPKTKSSYSPSGDELKLLELMNSARKEAGVQPLSYDYGRASVADVRVYEIMQVQSHTRPNGKDCFSVASEQGVSASAMGENLYWGNKKGSIAENAHSALMNSKGHRDNILSSNYKTVAIRIAQDGSGNKYVVQYFFG